MNKWRRKLELVCNHPARVAGEIAARSRCLVAPRRGVRRKRIGRIDFEFDMDLDIHIRRMYAGAYETEMVGLLKVLLSEGDTFVDAGANIGYLSGLAADCVGLTGRVLSFEPAPVCFERLHALRGLNPRFRWEVYPFALGSQPASMPLAISGTNIGWNSLVTEQIPTEGKASTIAVDVRRLDDCLDASAVDGVKVLKIDTEGFEVQVVLGAEANLRAGKIDNLLIEVQRHSLVPSGPGFEQMVDLLTECGYKLRQTRSPYRQIQPDSLVNGQNVWFRRN